MAVNLKQSTVPTAKPVAVAAATVVASVVAEKKGPSELDKVLTQIKKDKGDKVVIMGRNVPMPARIPTGMFEFDFGTGGGVPRGRISIFYGPESSGKTNHAYGAIRNAQRLPPPCNKAVLVDLEGTFDPLWAARCGVDVDALVVVKPAYGEEAVDLVDAIVRAEDVAILVVDSIASLISSKEIEQSVEKFDVGTAAILIKRMTNKVVVALAMEGRRGHEPAVIFINQTRFKIGVMFGDPETMPGGNTPKFLSSLTVRFYGVNEFDNAVSKEMPRWKKTTATIKKAKVGVLSYKMEYLVSMMDADGLSCCETNSWNMVKSHLQNLGLLEKEGNKGWKLFDKVYAKQEIIQDTYLAEPEFAGMLQQAVVKAFSGQAFLVEAKDDVPPETGEPATADGV